jgi:hypothetical protein
MGRSCRSDFRIRPSPMSTGLLDESWRRSPAPIWDENTTKEVMSSEMALTSCGEVPRHSMVPSNSGVRRHHLCLYSQVMYLSNRLGSGRGTQRSVQTPRVLRTLINRLWDCVHILSNTWNSATPQRTISHSSPESWQKRVRRESLQVGSASLPATATNTLDWPASWPCQS